MKSRRDFLKVAASSVIATQTTGIQNAVASVAQPQSEEEAFVQWYDVDRSVTNLENAYWNVMARPVMEQYFRELTYINRRNVPFVRGVLPDESLPAELLKVRVAVANLINADVEEIALTRCGTEALQDLIIGYNRLTPGDSVIFGDLDYDAMQNNMFFLKERRGVEIVTFPMPEPATTENILGAYETVLAANPKTRLMLVTHLCHRPAS